MRTKLACLTVAIGVAATACGTPTRGIDLPPTAARASQDDEGCLLPPYNPDVDPSPPDPTVGCDGGASHSTQDPISARPRGSGPNAWPWARGRGQSVMASNEPGTIGGARQVGPTPGLVDVRPQTIDRIETLTDGRSLRVFFYSGVEECYGLDRIEVEYRPEAIVMTVYVGRLPHAEVCIDLAEYQVTTAVLGERVNGRTIIDGASPTAG